jgi:hypothetical protein
MLSDVTRTVRRTRSHQSSGSSIEVARVGGVSASTGAIVPND